MIYDITPFCAHKSPIILGVFWRGLVKTGEEGDFCMKSTVCLNTGTKIEYIE